MTAFSYNPSVIINSTTDMYQIQRSKDIITVSHNQTYCVQISCWNDWNRKVELAVQSFSVLSQLRKIKCPSISFDVLKVYNP